MACGLKFHWYLRTLSLKFQLNWDSQQDRDRKTSILLVFFWNKLKVLKYPRNCRLHATLILKVKNKFWIDKCTSNKGYKGCSNSECIFDLFVFNRIQIKRKLSVEQLYGQFRFLILLNNYDEKEILFEFYLLTFRDVGSWEGGRGRTPTLIGVLFSEAIYS